MSYMNTDIPELGGFDTGIVLENLGVIFGRQEPWLEASVTQLSELADAILKDASQDPDTLYSILLSLQGYANEGFGNASRPDLPYVRGMEKSLGVYQRLLLYHFLYLKLGKLPPLTGHTRREIPPTAQGRIAYMKSALANKAYIRFAQCLPNCRAADFHSFVDACEEVAGGLCEYCILPLHTSADGLLMSFYRLMVKYRLQIVATYRVEHRTGGQAGSTTFGLLRSMGEAYDFSDLWDTPFLASQESLPLSLSLLYTAERKDAFGSILSAAECCSLSPGPMGSLPYAEIAPLLMSVSSDTGESDPSQNIFFLSFHLGTTLEMQKTKASQSLAAMPQAFLMHLMVEAGDNLILGLYPQLN